MTASPDDLLQCPVCATRFDPRGHRACPTCPLHGGCALACCPTCGHTTIDPAASTIVRAAGRARGLLRRREPLGAPDGPA